MAEPFRPQELTDPRAMRALAHPTRLALLEALAHAGRALTATETAEQVGESPSSCSFHLRQLAKYGFVEEAEDAAGRRRPWRLTRLGLSFGTEDRDDAETVRAAAVLERALRDRYFARAATALDAAPAEPQAWRRGLGLSQYVLHVTAAELEQVQAEMLALLLRHRDRMVDPSLRPDGSRPIEVLTVAYPLDPGA
ncbi:MAG TPA: winged helix-turn-helix domain-containing protein [Capillimicrobium sp.]|jgi:DNA-binding transcriptional ArsR family regulator